MAANETPIYTRVPVIKMANISVANTNRDGTGTITTIVTGATDGTRIHKIDIKALVTTTAGMIRLYLADDAETPNIRLWKEIVVGAIIVAAGTAGFEYSLYLTGETALILPYGYSLRASTHNAESFNIVAEGGNY